MKVKLLVGALVFLIIVNLTALGSYLYVQMTSPDPFPSAPSGDITMPHKRMEERPGARLDREQWAQLRNLLDNFQQETKELNMEINQLEVATFTLLQQIPVPEDQLLANLEKISALKLEISKVAVLKMTEAKNFLKPDQQIRFFNMIMKAGPGMNRPYMRHRKSVNIVKPDTL
ncbi:MAG: hypothetical protein AB7T22_11235 [Calditrichaceae bacterium]